MAIRVSVVMAAVLALTGCGASPMQWEIPESAPADTMGRLALTPSDSISFARQPVPPRVPADSARCEGSMTFAGDSGRTYAVWLHRAPGGRVIVLAAGSADSGRTWRRPGIVDSVDVGTSGCEHPLPSIAASAGYVHIAYSLDAPEGFGVFFAHSMDQTATFHSALPVIYGDRLSSTAVAADGMRVVVAYEDPNGGGHRVAIAVSNTQGHSFDARLRGSMDEMDATRPEIAVRGTTVALSFAAPDGARSLRIGHLQ